jgi:hypothetical protein
MKVFEYPKVELGGNSNTYPRKIAINQTNSSSKIVKWGMFQICFLPDFISCKSHILRMIVNYHQQGQPSFEKLLALDRSYITEITTCNH